MAELTPTFQGEVQLRRWSESSTQGVQVTFALSESADLDKFKGLDGKRFMAVLVQIGDDEQPVKSDIGIPTSGKQREPLGDLCWRAVQWCKESAFANFIADVFYAKYPQGLSDTPVLLEGASTEEFSKHAIRALCDIESRKELDTNPEAARKFNQLIRGPYQKHLIARGIVR
jgi:hypothetical protein